MSELMSDYVISMLNVIVSVLSAQRGVSLSHRGGLKRCAECERDPLAESDPQQKICELFDH